MNRALSQYSSAHHVPTQDIDGAFSVNNLSNSTDHANASRRWFSAMLWRAFPSRSEHELAQRAAPVLNVSTRQVRNWLREENDPALRHVTAVLLIAGVELGLGNTRRSE